MRNDSIYIKTDGACNLVHTSGVVFRDFFRGVGLGDRGFLILAGFPSECHFSMDLLLEYVSKDQTEALAAENVYNYGDFCWVDFEKEEQLSSVTKEELAEMLYMSHMKKPLHSFKIGSLNNRFAYLCHDDGWWNNVYMEDISEYKSVLKYILMKELKGRKRAINEPDSELMDTIFEMCSEGLVIDFEKKTGDGVNLFCVGDISTMDELENRIDRYRNKNCQSILYNSRRKTWELFGSGKGEEKNDNI
jgi:hypothetical protein